MATQIKAKAQGGLKMETVKRDTQIIKDVGMFLMQDRNRYHMSKQEIDKIKESVKILQERLRKHG